MSTAESALLAESANFRLVLELLPCDPVPPLIEVRIVSWYDDAKDTQTPQQRFQTFVTPDALLRLKNALEAVLARSGHHCEQSGG